MTYLVVLSPRKFGVYHLFAALIVHAYKISVPETCSIASLISTICIADTCPSEGR